MQAGGKAYEPLYRKARGQHRSGSVSPDIACFYSGKGGVAGVSAPIPAQNPRAVKDWAYTNHKPMLNHQEAGSSLVWVPSDSKKLLLNREAASWNWSCALATRSFLKEGV